VDGASGVVLALQVGLLPSASEDGRLVRQGDASWSQTLDLQGYGALCCLVGCGGEPDALLVDQDDQTVVASDRGEVRPLRGKDGQQTWFRCQLFR